MYYPFIIAVILLVFFFISWPAIKLKQKLYEKTKKFPKGHYINLGLLLGMGLGMIFDKIVFGIPIGLVFGLALEKKNNHKLRKLTKEEIILNKRVTYVGIVVLVIGVALLFLFK